VGIMSKRRFVQGDSVDKVASFADDPFERRIARHEQGAPAAESCCTGGEFSEDRPAQDGLGFFEDPGVRPTVQLSRHGMHVTCSLAGSRKAGVGIENNHVCVPGFRCRAALNDGAPAVLVGDGREFGGTGQVISEDYERAAQQNTGLTNAWRCVDMLQAGNGCHTADFFNDFDREPGRQFRRRAQNSKLIPAEKPGPARKLDPQTPSTPTEKAALSRILASIAMLPCTKFLSLARPGAL
jgi:hypothetical protein